MTKSEKNHCFPNSIDAYSETESRYKTETLKINGIDIASKTTTEYEGEIQIEGKHMALANKTISNISIYTVIVSFF